MVEIELLAPAKDLECGIAAIDCGADAVYIGAPRFGAREAAGNSLEDIAELTAYAHNYWARVYVTLNTLLRDEEIPEAVSTGLAACGYRSRRPDNSGYRPAGMRPAAHPAHRQHPDAQYKSRKRSRSWRKSASAGQSSSASWIWIKSGKSAGRPTSNWSSSSTARFASATADNVYLSYALGGRSGNRGQCAQPCRKAYTLLDSRGKAIVTNKHLLSLMDLNLSGHLRELIEAGICSLKIEGRLKDKAYVTNVVAYYRARLDEVLADLGLKKSSSGVSRVDFTPDPAKTFNRGYSNYFIDGRD